MCQSPCCCAVFPFQAQLEELEVAYEAQFNELQEKLVELISVDKEKMQFMADEIALLKDELASKSRQIQEEELRGNKARWCCAMPIAAPAHWFVVVLPAFVEIAVGGRAPSHDAVFLKRQRELVRVFPSSSVAHSVHTHSVRRPPAQQGFLNHASHCCCRHRSGECPVARVCLITHEMDGAVVTLLLRLRADTGRLPSK